MTTPNNLPAELTSFVGRERQLAELRRLLHRSRLITLTGPGGSGKTRLAVRVAAESLDKFRDGVWLVDLAPIGEGRLLEHTLVSVIGITEGSHREAADVLAEGLGNRSTLLVLDGCEHLVDSCARLSSRLLSSCPKLSIVVTSREPLGVAGELIWRTPSLTLPRPEDASHPELLMESEAIRLFVDRARLSRPDFELDASAATALVQVCTRLEGIPLAIELAAGLASVMTLDEILDRLRHRFRLLTGGSRTALPRHQTLRQAVDWSYGLLSREQQVLFSRLGVFAGGFDLAAAEAIVQGDSLAVDDVLPLLSQLIHKSLVVAEPARPHTTRYRMLDTIREYALEKLEESEQVDLRRRHAMYFRDWSIRATHELSSAEQFAWLRRLDEEQANIRLALEWTLSESPDDGLRLVGAIDRYFWMRRHVSEGLEWLDRALALPNPKEELRAAALVARARLRRRHGDYEGAGIDAEEGAGISRRLGLDQLLMRGSTILGIVTSHQRDYPTAGRYFGEALGLAQRLQDRNNIASCLNNLAIIESAEGRHQVAQERVEEALALSDELGDRFLKANILDTAARIHLRLGEHELAAARYREALAISAEFEDSMNIADCLSGLALLADMHNDPSRAITLISAAQAMRKAAGGVRTPEWSIEVDAGLERAKKKAGRTVAEAAWRKGAELGLQEAVRFALGTSRLERRDGNSRLTDREIEVAKLIATGLTNGEVGATLRISERTVDAHVEHIRNKIGLRTRTQIAVWAKERLGTS